VRIKCLIKLLQTVLKNNTIVLVLPRGETIRNFIYSGTAKLIRDKAKLVIISVIPNNEVKADLMNHCDEFHELKYQKEFYKIGFVREVLDLAHNKFIWTKASQVRFHLRDRDAKTIKQKTKRITKKFLAYLFANQRGLHLLSKLDEKLSSKDESAKYWINLLKTIEPSLVFNTSHIHNKNSLPILHAAKYLQLKTATFLFSWDNLTSQGRIMPSYNNYLVWNKAIKNDLLSMYPNINSKNVSVVGTSQFDFHFNENEYMSKEAFALENGLDSQKKWVLYTTGMPNHMPFEPEVVEQIADVLKEHPEGPQLLLRVYPKDKTNRFEDLRNKRKDIIFQKVPWEPNHLTPLKSDLKLFTNTIRHVSLGINVASTVSLELAMFDKPIINVAYNPPSLDEEQLKYVDYYDFEHYKKIVNTNAIQLVKNKKELKTWIYTFLEDSNIRSEDRKFLINSFFDGELDGSAHIKLAQTILNII